MRQSSRGPTAARELLGRLNETQLALAGADPDLEALMALVMDRALELTGADGASFTMVEGTDVVVRAESGTTSGMVGIRVPIAETAAREAIETGRAYLIPSLAEATWSSMRRYDDGGDGSLVCVPLFVNGKPVGTLNAARRGEGVLDETDLQTLELLGGMMSSALVRVREREALGKFEALFRDSPLGIALLAPDAAVTQMNRAFAHMIGREPGESFDIHETLELIHEDDRPGAEEKLGGLLTGAIESSSMELRLVAADGTVSCLDGSGQVVRDDRGAMDFILVMAQDVTERKRVEDVLRNTTERLSAVVDAQREATAAQSLEQASAVVARVACELAAADGAVVELLQEDGGVVVRAAVGSLAALAGLPGDAPEAEALLAEHATHMRVPVLHGERRLGWLRVVAGPRTWPAESMQALELLAVVLAAAVSRAAEADARAVLEAVFYRDSPVGIGLMGLDGGLLEVNDALVRDSGFTREQMLSMTPEEYLHPDDFDRMGNEMPQLISGELEFSRKEHRLRPVDGVVRWKDSLVSVVRNPDGSPRYSLLVSLDVTERKQAEMALREQTERLAAIVETQAEVAAVGAELPDVMALVTGRALELTGADAATVGMLDDDDLEIQVAVGAAKHMVGRRIPLSQSGMRYAIETGRAVLIESAASDDRVSRELARELGDVSVVYVPVWRAGNVVGCLVASSSAGARLGGEDRQTLELLGGVLSSALARAAERESEHKRVEALTRFEKIYRDAPIGIGMLSLREGPRWLGMNERMEEIRGYSAVELNELDPAEYIHPDDGETLHQQYLALQRGSSDFERITLRQFRKDRSLVWTESAVSLVRDDAGEPWFAIVMVHDVTESKLAQDAMRRHSERLARIIETQAEVAAAESDLPEALRIVAERAHTLTRAEGVTATLVDGDERVVVAAAGKSEVAVGTRSPLARSLTGITIASESAILITDATADPRLQGIPHAKAHSYVCAPLFHGERAVGTLNILSGSVDDPLTEEDRQTLELLAVVVSSSVSRTAEVDALTKFERIYRGAPIGLGLIGPDGHFTEANQVLCDILRCTPEELTAVPLGQLVHPDDRKYVGENWRRLLAGESDSFRGERRLVTGDNVTWLDAAISLVREPDGTPRFAIFMGQDTTQRKQAELALQESNERLARIVESQGEVAALGADVDAVARLIVDRAVELTRAEGASASLVEGGEVVTRASTGIAADLAGYRRPLERTVTAAAIEAGRSVLIERAEDDPRLYRPLAAKTGERSHICVPLYRGGRCIGSLSAQSSSEHERLDESDLRTLELLGVLLSSGISRASETEALERFEAIFRDAPIGIGLLSLDGRFVDANDAMCQISGFERSGRPVSEWTHPEDLEVVVGTFRRLVDGELDSYRLEARYLRSDGGVAWVDTSVSLLRDADGTPQFALAMAQDVTERRAAEEQLRQSQKIDAIGQLSAGIAHDFNNLLMGVLGYAGLARGELEPGSRVAEYLDKIETTGHRAASLTKQLLAFGRRQTLQPRQLDLNELIGETLSMLGRVLGEHIEIVPRLDPTLPELRADPTQLQQVLFNLALNARDAMPGGGTLTIETQLVELGEADHGGLELEPGRYVVLTVDDTGFGMSDDVRERIFEPFFTTKGVGEGTGLGLPSVYGIVKQSRGDIEVTSRQHEGSTFRIYLPAAGPRTVLGRDRAARPPRVLLVEEAEVVRELVTKLLGDQGYEVIVAEGVEDALRLAREEEALDVLVTDLVIGRSRGTDLAAQVQEHQPSIQVLYMSAYEPDERVPAESLIPKPFSNEALLAKLDELRAAR